MKFPKDTPVTEKKKNQLLVRIEQLGIDLSAVTEGFIRAQGPGGQKVNKTSSAVMLHYPPHDVTVKWSTERSRAMNRFFALRELADQVEEKISPETSKRLKERDRLKGRKHQKRKKQRRKEAESSEQAES
jgi:protein subunit release factor B